MCQVRDQIVLAMRLVTQSLLHLTPTVTHAVKGALDLQEVAVDVVPGVGVIDQAILNTSSQHTIGMLLALFVALVVQGSAAQEHHARVHAQLRRYTSYGSRAQAAESPTIQLDGLEINRDARSVTVDGSPVRLTPTEYSILLYLVEHRGSVVAVEDLFRAVWNEDFMPGSNNTVMVHIRHLREKIGDDAQKPRFIKNVWGVGYIIE